MNPILGMVDVVVSAYSYTYATAQIEEKPILNLKETLEDALFRSLQTQSITYQGMKPGREWYINAVMHDKVGLYEDIHAYGPCRFRWVCNRSGSPMPLGTLATFYSLTVTNLDSGAIGSVTKAATFEAAEQTHNLVVVADDAGGAGAAPEGEARYIIRNTAATLYVQPDFTVAPAINDDLEIISDCMVVDAQAGDDRSEVAGVVVSPDGIPDNYWGWLAFTGRVRALATVDVITKGTRLIAGAALINDNAGPNYFEDIGFIPVGGQNDLASGLLLVQLELPVF